MTGKEINYLLKVFGLSVPEDTDYFFVHLINNTLREDDSLAETFFELKERICDAYLRYGIELDVKENHRLPRFLELYLEKKEKVAEEEYDAHSCRAEANEYGICQWCGAIVSGTTADYELHGYDPI